MHLRFQNLLACPLPRGQEIIVATRGLCMLLVQEAWGEVPKMFKGVITVVTHQQPPEKQSSCVERRGQKLVCPLLRWASLDLVVDVGTRTTWNAASEAISDLLITTVLSC